VSRGDAKARRSTVTLHMVSSLDGIIAKKDNSVSWLDSTGDVYEKGVSEGDADDIVPSIDCFVLGSPPTSMRYSSAGRMATLQPS